MNSKTYLAVGELAQAAAHAHGLVGPVEFTVCRPRNYDWCGCDDDYVEFPDGPGDEPDLQASPGLTPSAGGHLHLSTIA